MYLSSILKEMSYKDYKILGEQEIDYLALSASELNQKVCIFLDNEKYIRDIKSNVSMILTNTRLKDKIVYNDSSCGLCIVEEPRTLFFMIHNYLKNNCEYVRKKFSTSIGENCNIHPYSSVSANNVIIGNNVMIEEFVVVRENTVIGDNCIIRSGAKIGSEGFEFKRCGKEILSVIHLGGVKIGNNVEIQCNTCIDKAVYPWDDTRIGDYVKIDNLVHIGHAAKIENNVMIVANSGIGGRTEINSNTWVGFSTTVSNGLNIGTNARINIGSVVTKNVNDGQSVTGNFAIDHSCFIDNIKKIANSK